MGYLSVYGLNIFSKINFGILEFIIPDKRLKNQLDNVNLTLMPSQCELEIEKDSSEDYYPFSDDFSISWEDVGTFKFFNGREIVIYPKKNVNCPTLKLYILGAVLAAILQQRGFLVLHASAVKVDNYAVAFLGSSGMGKSTIAMALNKEGYPLITDDILAIQFDDNGVPIVYPGLPQTNMSPQSIFSIYGIEGNVSIMPSGTEERLSCLTSCFSKNPLPLKRVYVMKNNHNSKIELLGSQNALMELLNHSYFSNQFQEKDKALNLAQCSSVFKHITIRTLKINKSLEKLPEVVKLIEEDVSSDFEEPVKSFPRS